MGWSCRRPGCNREADVCISYDAVACQVWLDPIAVGPKGGQPLCLDHAARLSAPRGWVVLDRRGSQSNLMAAPGESGAGAEPDPRQPPVVRRRYTRGWGQFDAPTLEFVSDDGVDASPASMADFVPKGRAAAVFGTVSEPEPVGSADPAPPPGPPPGPAPAPVGRPKGRLLSRAFESAGPQRSVLTEGLGRDEPQPTGSEAPPAESRER